MITRILPPAEWPKLAGTELETIWPHLRPDESVVLVIEDQGAIVGCWALFRQWHVEGITISASHRGKAGVARALIRGMRTLMAELGIRTLVTGCLSPLVAKLLAHWQAVKLPGDLYVFSPKGD